MIIFQVKKLPRCCNYSAKVSKIDLQIFTGLKMKYACLKILLQWMFLRRQDLFREKSLPDFYAALDSYPNLRNLGMKMTTAFASTYICEQTFSTLKRAKPASRLSDDHLHSILRMNVTQLEPNIKKLVSEKQHQTSH
nr:PREDICTED: EPM2A-interacting protein 1-like [Tribolium castaneum]|eukprot:XP_008191156.1 PREDICTED: EPM2A-interacting protein 1-like [Tribolium castaneum]